MELAKNILPKSKKKLLLNEEQLQELQENPTVQLDLMTILTSPEFELCLHQTLSSFKREKDEKKGAFKYKRSAANRLHDKYCSEEGLAQFAVDYILARNGEFKEVAAIRRGVLVVGNNCVQIAAKQISERLIVEREAESETQKPEGNVDELEL